MTSEVKRKESKIAKFEGKCIQIRKYENISCYFFFSAVTIYQQEIGIVGAFHFEELKDCLVP